jgi:hypothetical protein
MATKLITISFTASGYAAGDYGLLYGDGGSGTIDWDTPVSAKRYDLLPAGQDEQTITALVRVRDCGTYQFGFKAFDAAGNASAGAPEEASLEVHVIPDKATKLKKVSYNKTTDTLILEVA